MNRYGDRTPLGVDASSSRRPLLKHILGTVVIVFALLSFFTFIGWMSYGNDFFVYKFFFAAPTSETEGDHTHLFEQSSTYDASILQVVQQTLTQYNAAQTSEERERLREALLQEAATYDADKLPEELATFLRHMRQPQSPKTN